MKQTKNKKEGNLYPSECTSILVGEKMMADGSIVVARSEDWDAMIAKNFEIYQDTEEGATEFVARDSDFRCELPKKALGYAALAPYHLPGHWGSAGFNSAGVGMSATESIFSSEAALKADPMPQSGIGENSVFNIVLPYIHSAKEGVQYLGKLIEKHGVKEGFGIGFVDNNESWYLETACGHRWMATRIPKEKYFVTGNQSRFRKYDPKDTSNFLASEDLISFAEAHGLYKASQGEFDFHEAYARDVKLDTTYNYPRVWGLQALFSPKIANDVTKNTFPVFAEAEKAITIAKLRDAFRFHYDNTDHDPYLNSNPKETYRPVSIFRTTQTHILQVRPGLPKEIGCVNYVALGMADLGVFFPLYQGVKSYPKAYTIGTNVSDSESAYWRLRKVACLGMVNYNSYAPYIKETYKKLEEELDQRMSEFEADYMEIYKKQPLKAQEMLQNASDKMLCRVLEVTDALVEELFTRLTRDIQKEYRFAGA